MYGQIIDISTPHDSENTVIKKDTFETLHADDLLKLNANHIAAILLSDTDVADTLCRADNFSRDNIFLIVDSQAPASLVTQMLKAEYHNIFVTEAELTEAVNLKLKKYFSSKETQLFCEMLSRKKIYTWSYHTASRMVQINDTMQVDFQAFDTFYQHDFEKLYSGHIYPGDIFLVRHFTEQLNQCRDVEDISIRLINRNKEILWYRISAEYHPEHSRYYGICQNIQSEKINDERIIMETVKYHRLKEQIRKIQKLSKVGTWKLHRKQMKFAWEAETAQILGMPAHTLMSTEDFLHSVYPSDREHFRTSIDKLVSAPSDEPFEFRLSSHQHPLLYIQMQAAESNTDMPQPSTIEGTLQDISALKIYSLELEAKNIQLQNINHNIINHTAEIEAARKKAEESDTLKTSFLSNISHEVRTPISSIGGFAELLRSEGLTSEQRERYIGLILHSNKLLLHIFTDVLELSKINSNQMRINNSQLNINYVLREISDEYQSLVHAKRLQIALDLPTDEKAHIIISDGNKIHRILSAIMDNAIKFTDSGTIRLSYTLDAGTLTIQIQDTGIGIPEEKLRYIFQPFRQGDETLGRCYGGMGIGLSIVDGLVKLLGGTISLNTKLGLGTTVRFSMPAILSDEKGNMQTDTQEDWSEKTVLVVEDNIINFLYLEEMLACSGTQIIHTSTVAETKLALVNNSDISAVILDFGLPDGNGSELLRFMHEKGLYRPTLIITANSIESVKKRCSEYIFEDVLSKPFMKNDFIAKIDKLLFATR